MTNLKRILVLLILFSFIVLQAAHIEGYIRDKEDGNALSGSSIYFKLSKVGTVSEKSGYFRLEMSRQPDDTLIVDMMGYRTQKFSVNNITDRSVVILMETDILDLGNDVIVTSTRRPISINNTSVAMDVVEKVEIENSNAQNIAELLEQLTSLLVRDYGGIGNMKTISLRGTNAGHVLVMVDGHRINNPQNGEVDLALIPLNYVERIEVLRGGSSALYGSDAIGGVVQIITKGNNKENIFALGIKQNFASFGTYSIESHISSSIGRLGIIGSYHYLSSEGDFSYMNDLSEIKKRVNNDVKRHNVYTALNYSASNKAEALKIKLNYNYLNSDRGAPGTTSFPYPYARLFDEQYDIGLSILKKTTNLKHQLSVKTYYFNNFNRYLNQHPTEVLFPTDDNYLTQATGGEIQMTSIVLPQFVMNYGMSIRQDKFSNLGLDVEYDRLSYAAYLVSENMFVFPSTIIPKVKITPSIRYNGNDKFKDMWTPKVGLLVNMGVSGQLALKSNYSYNYRIPTFNDLYWPADAYTSGNPELLPELGNDWDIGLRYQNDFLNAEISYFNENLTNLIIWQGVNWVWTPQNVAESRINGVENNMKIKMWNDIINLSANYTFMNALDITNGIENATFLPNRAKHHANMKLSASLDDFDLGYSVQFVSKRYSDTDNTEELALASYWLNNINLGYTLNLNMFKIQGIFEIKNLFNASYSILQGLPMPGREFRFTINTELNKMK